MEMGRVVDTFDPSYEEPEEHFETALACANGHVITATLRAEPKKKASFCSTCGEPTVSACSRCSKPLKGAYWREELGYLLGGYRLPNYCDECGEPFEWTKRLISEATAAIRRSEQVSSADVEQFATDLPEIIKQSSKAVAATSRARSVLQRVGASTRQVVRDIFVQVVSNAVTSQIFGGR